MCFNLASFHLAGNLFLAPEAGTEGLKKKVYETEFMSVFSRQ